MLEFNRNVSDCAVVSALGGYPVGPGFNTGIPGGMVGASVRGSGPPKNRQVAVITRLTDGTVKDRSFHLAVIC